MDFSYGLAQALAVKDNRIFTLEQKRTELYNEIDRLQHIVNEKDTYISELQNELSKLHNQYMELKGDA